MTPRIPPDSRRANRLVAVVATLLQGTALMAAAADQPPVAAISGERVVVELVEVDLWAVDEKGRPVTDLRRGELELREDGAAVPIEQFDAWRGGAPATVRAEPAPDGGDATPLAAPSTVAIFFDDAHLDPGRRERVAREIADWVDRHLERDAWVLLALHDRETAIAVPRTQDHRRLRSTLASLAYNTMGALVLELEQRRVLAEIRERQRQALEVRYEGPEPPCARQFLNTAEAFADQVEGPARSTLQALARFATGLGTLPDRKLLLFVSDGVPARPGAAAFDLVRTLCDGSGARQGLQWAIDVASGGSNPAQLDAPALAFAGENRNLAGLAERVSANANAAGVTIWTLGARGLTASGTDASEEVRSSTGDDAFRRSAEADDVATLLANRTGGRAIVGRGDFAAALAPLGDDLSSGYALAYRSPRSGDGRIHRIELRTTRPDVRLRHRTSWREIPGEEDLAALVESGAVHGLDRPGLGAALALQERRGGVAGEARAVVRLSIPADRVLLLPGVDGRLTGTLRIAIGTLAGPGALGAVRGRLWPLEVDAHAETAPEGARPASFVREIELPLAPGATTTVLLGLRDELSGESALLRLEIPAEDRR